MDDACFGVDTSDPKQAQIQIGKKDPCNYQSDHAWEMSVKFIMGHWTAPNVQLYIGNTGFGSGAQNVVFGELFEVFFERSNGELVLG